MSASIETIRANTPLFAYALGAQDERQRINDELEDLLADAQRQAPSVSMVAYINALTDAMTIVNGGQK